MTDTFPVLFDRGLAQALDDLGVGFYKASGTYTALETPIATPGIFPMGPDLPLTIDNCIVLTALDPIADGRANLIHRVQVFTRLKGTKAQAKNLAWSIREALDLKQDIPAGFNISWVWQFSQLAFTADSNGRNSTAQTFYFRGRRPLA